MALPKNPMVYVVVYNSPDVHQDFVRIHGIFSSREEAQKRREELFDHNGVECDIRSFFILDLLESKNETRKTAKG